MNNAKPASIINLFTSVGFCPLPLQNPQTITGVSFFSTIGEIGSGMSGFTIAFHEAIILHVLFANSL